jgi:hypothetical protein
MQNGRQLTAITTTITNITATTNTTTTPPKKRSRKVERAGKVEGEET